MNWNKTSDSLPPENEWVLLMTTSNCFMVGKLVSQRSKKVFRVGGIGGYAISSVKHWSHIQAPK